VNKVVEWVKANPTRASAALVVIVGWIGTAGVPDTITAGILTLVGILIGGPVFNAVTPVVNVVAATRTAALDAAAQVASRLDEQTAGAAGAITEAAAPLIATAADGAADAALRTLGVKRSQR
jgi:hypothetical protein